ncbi:hypothetical protein B0T21DRAFT_407500 [Apiosordaria backusii]|uniref:Uncharacterized protein n=1 Tax=Apiosordaria backusii TaxID=314023 RepID=A0AA40K3B7_9PEZI|nr:hypothetical protein B0T21DRAFT_407500 [Apiosordaria backusii]
MADETAELSLQQEFINTLRALQRFAENCEQRLANLEAAQRPPSTKTSRNETSEDKHHTQPTCTQPAKSKVQAAVAYPATDDGIDGLRWFYYETIPDFRRRIEGKARGWHYWRTLDTSHIDEQNRYFSREARCNDVPSDVEFWSRSVSGRGIPDYVPPWELVKHLDDKWYHIDDLEHTNPVEFNELVASELSEHPAQLIPYALAPPLPEEALFSTTGLGDKRELIMKSVGRLYAVPPDSRIPLKFEKNSLRRICHNAQFSNVSFDDELKDFNIVFDLLQTAGGEFLVHDFDDFMSMVIFDSRIESWESSDAADKDLFGFMASPARQAEEILNIPPLAYRIGSNFIHDQDQAKPWHRILSFRGLAQFAARGATIERRAFTVGFYPQKIAGQPWMDLLLGDAGVPLSPYWTYIVLIPEDMGMHKILPSTKPPRLPSPAFWVYSLIHYALEEAVMSWKHVEGEISKLLDTDRDAVFDPETHDLLLFDDSNFSRSRLYFWAEDILTVFVRELRVTIDHCEDWRGGWVDVFRANEQNYIELVKARLKADTEGRPHLAVDIRKLQDQLTRFEQTLENVKSMRNSLFTASGAMESRAATDLGRNVRLLTYVSIFYLPLGDRYYAVRRPLMEYMAKDVEWEQTEKRFKRFPPEREVGTLSKWVILRYACVWARNKVMEKLRFKGRETQPATGPPDATDLPSH